MPFPKRDCTGQRFGRLVVTGEAERGDNTKHRWLMCRCDCGTECRVRLANLRSGQTKSCGCFQRENLARVHEARQRSLVGKRYGRLLVIEPAPSRRLGNKWHGYWKCQCDCGNETVVQRAALTSRATQSCGCFHRDQLSHRTLTHGGTHWPEYKIWGAIVQRCTNPKNAAFSHYGGRGIKICDEWRTSFERFITDVGRRPQPGMQLDRRNNNGNYEPGNVAWVSREENMRNRAFISRDEAEQLKATIARYEALHGPLGEAE